MEYKCIIILYPNNCFHIICSHCFLLLPHPTNIKTTLGFFTSCSNEVTTSEKKTWKHHEHLLSNTMNIFYSQTNWKNGITPRKKGENTRLGIVVAPSCRVFRDDLSCSWWLGTRKREPRYGDGAVRSRFAGKHKRWRRVPGPLTLKANVLLWI